MRSSRHHFIVLAGSTLLMLVAGCANPFIENYNGRRQASELDPVRVRQPIEGRRLGTSRFDIDSNVTGVPGDAQAKAAAIEVGAAAYYWKREPKFNAGNTGSRFTESGASTVGAKFNSRGFNEKMIKWYVFDAIFYADAPKTDAGT